MYENGLFTPDPNPHRKGPPSLWTYAGVLVAIVAIVVGGYIVVKRVRAIQQMQLPGQVWIRR
ncbi:hypothetical protein Pan216_50590 [Planctomycetes bacterium Pan216]|uniref:Uncharacterized protein n=1 Tax=Kolteria novifilia TaxID=2527975 RepID=A0A518BB06_9BACT|nr:hypothetical protein Pan216_50590 [Planctomycetes bacterium Pan216]